MISRLTKRYRIRLDTHGFTIIELMVATLIFSLVLVVITSGILSFTHGYYKGLNESRTQAAAQNAIDQITQSVQYSSEQMQPYADPRSGKILAYCFGNVQYIFVQGAEQMASPDVGQTAHGLYRKTLPSGLSGCPAPAAFNANDSTDLLTNRMRVADLQVNAVSTGVYAVQVSIVYGDNDLLDNPTTPGAKCKTGTVGTQFCAVSQLSTTVQMRKV